MMATVGRTVEQTTEPAGSDEPLLPSDTYITLSGIDWRTFEGIADRTRGGRITYDGGELEIMSPSRRHEGFTGRMRDLVAILSAAMGIEEIGLGSTTWKSPLANKGSEADAAFYLDPSKFPIVAGLDDEGEEDITRFPPPDLMIEIDMRSPAKDRLAVYAAIGAVEVWEFNGKTVRIRRLGPDGTYADVDRSGWLRISSALIATAIRDAPLGDEARRRWMRAFVARHLGR